MNGDSIAEAYSPCDKDTFVENEPHYSVSS